MLIESEKYDSRMPKQSLKTSYLIQVFVLVSLVNDLPFSTELLKLGQTGFNIFVGPQCVSLL